MEHLESISAGSDQTTGKACVMPASRRWFWITCDFPSAISMPSQRLQQWQRSRLLQQVRDMAIRMCFSYLAKQGQGRWGDGAQITLNSIVLQLGQMGCDLSLGHKLQGLQSSACLWIVGFSSLPGTPFPYTSVGSGQKRVQLQVAWPCCLSPEVLPPWFVSFSGERGETEESLVKHWS